MSLPTELCILHFTNNGGIDHTMSTLPTLHLLPFLGLKKPPPAGP